MPDLSHRRRWLIACQLATFARLGAWLVAPGAPGTHRPARLRRVQQVALWNLLRPLRELWP